MIQYLVRKARGLEEYLIGICETFPQHFFLGFLLREAAHIFSSSVFSIWNLKFVLGFSIAFPLKFKSELRYEHDKIQESKINKLLIKSIILQISLLHELKFIQTNSRYVILIQKFKERNGRIARKLQISLNKYSNIALKDIHSYARSSKKGIALY